MVKRRTFARDGTQPAYGFAELARLLDVTQQRARLLVQNLVAAGLLTWSESAITFPDTAHRSPTTCSGPSPTPSAAARARSSSPGPSSASWPGGPPPPSSPSPWPPSSAASPAAADNPTAGGGSKPPGSPGPSAIGERQAKDARNQLVELGWLIVEGDNRQWAMNRWGRAYRIDLGWKPPARPIARSAPPPPVPAARSAPPLLDRNPLREEEIQNQNPASGGPAGVQLSEGEGETEIRIPTRRRQPGR